jgi:hypothetical protein
MRLENPFFNIPFPAPTERFNEKNAGGHPAAQDTDCYPLAV